MADPFIILVVSIAHKVEPYGLSQTVVFPLSFQ